MGKDLELKRESFGCNMDLRILRLESTCIMIKVFSESWSELPPQLQIKIFSRFSL